MRLSLREAADHSYRHPDFVREGLWLQVLNSFAMAFSPAGDTASARECFEATEGRVTESPWPGPRGPRRGLSEAALGGRPPELTRRPAPGPAPAGRAPPPPRLLRTPHPRPPAPPARPRKDFAVWYEQGTVHYRRARVLAEAERFPAALADVEAAVVAHAQGGEAGEAPRAEAVRMAALTEANGLGRYDEAVARLTTAAARCRKAGLPEAADTLNALRQEYLSRSGPDRDRGGAGPAGSAGHGTSGSGQAFTPGTRRYARGQVNG